MPDPIRDLTITYQKLVRAARSPAQGTHATYGSLQVNSPLDDTQILPDNSVRRLWIPGDPWDSNFYFGG